jgi:hypothetical protein
MDVMLDLETLGKAAGCTVLAIGACTFTPEQGPGDVFYEHLNIDQQVAFGLKMNPETVLWCMAQSDAARQSILGGQMKAKSLGDVLYEFEQWYARVGGTAIWGNGADFDLPILGALYDVVGRKRPWAYNAGRCMRTIFSLIGVKPGAFGSTNALAHDALADAIYQANETAAAMRYISSLCETRPIFVVNKAPK